MDSFQNANSLNKQQPKNVQKILFETYVKDKLFNALNNVIKDENNQWNNKCTQIVKASTKILNNLRNFSNSEYLYENFFNLIKLQYPIEQAALDQMSSKVKLRIASLLFCKYTNRHLIEERFEKVYPHLNWKTVNSIQKSLKLPLSESSPLCDKLKNYFYFGEMGKVSSCDQENYNGQGQLLLKKILILFIMQLDVLKCYVNCKANAKVFETKFDQGVHHENAEKTRNLLGDINNLVKAFTFKVDESLQTLSLDTLVDKIEIDLFQLYLLLSKVYLTKSKNAQTVTLKINQKQYSFRVTMLEQKYILNVKPKRKDELNKFAFKFIRKNVFLHFKNSLPNKEQKSSGEIKKLFNKKYLLGDPRSIDYYHSVDVSKKGIKHIKKCTDLLRVFKDFRDREYFQVQLEKVIFQKSGIIFQDKVTFEHFLKSLFCTQYKHSILLQDSMNSLAILDSFFGL